jgi:hypothetical protein
MTTIGDPRPSLVPPPVVELRGQIGADLAPYAQGLVRHVLAALGRPVLGARIRVVRHADPARERPVSASVLVDLGHGHVHAHVTAQHPREAVDLLADRLRRQVREARRGRPRSTPRPAALQHPASIVRRDLVQAVPVPVAEAAAILVDLDQDVHLFFERATGAPAVVYRGGPTGLRVAFRDGPEHADVPAALSCSAGPARRLSVEHAVEHLALSGLPFLFFVDPHGDGRLLHHAEGGAVLVDVTAGTDRPAGSGPTEREAGDPQH